MKFYFAGGAEEVGGSCIHVSCGGYRFLFDAGIRQGAGAADPLPDFHGIQLRGGLDAIIVSHAHMDHIGSLPVISKAYPHARIYMTKMTLDLARVLLADSLKLMDRREEEIPQYSEQDVADMLNRIVPVRYQAEQEILPGVRLSAYPAGHIAGAACMYLETEEANIFYSGDVSGFAQQSIEGAGIPKLRPDVMILESTYGDRLHASRRIEEDRLVEVAASCLQKGEKVLIPAFALGRAQEVLLLLRRAMQNERIPRVPVYVDGMIRDMNRVYMTNPEYLRRSLARRILKGNEPFYTEEIQPVPVRADRDLLLQQPEAAVFVASSGMLTGGPSMLYAKKLLSDEHACVILTGYQDEESPGRLLLNLLEAEQEERRVVLDGSSLPVRCRVEMVGLSAHADSSELTGIVERLGGRRVILVHGSQTAIGELGRLLSEDHRRQVWQPVCGEALEINLNSRRQQIKRQFPETMQNTTFDPDSDPVWLWNYCAAHYPGQAMTVQQAAYIWYGKTGVLKDSELDDFQSALLKSGCFSRHPRRLYLLVTNTEKEMEEARKAAEPTAQDVEKVLRSITEGIEVRRFGYYPEQKRAVLNVQFPDALNIELVQQWSDRLRQETGWTLTLKGSMNHQAAGSLLRSLFGERLQKTSYYQEHQYYQITLPAEEEQDSLHAKQFHRQTGWLLKISYADAPELAASHNMKDRVPNSESGMQRNGLSEETGWFIPETGVEMLEQNLAFSLVDLNFEDSPVRPRKRSRKNDHIGVYLELSFLSPQLGMRCAEQIRKLSNETGWRVHIAESADQNELLLLARELAGAYGVTLLKNPSWMPSERAVKLRIDPMTELPDKMREEFLERTGVPLIT